MRLAFPAVLVLASLPACLDPNPDFDGDTSTSDLDGPGPTADASSGDACAPADTGDEVQETGIVVGTFSFVLEDESSVDAFNMFVEGVGAGELHLDTDVALVLCGYVGCDQTPGPPPPCPAPATSATLDDSGLYGCCRVGVLDVAYECPAESGAKLHMRVSGADAPCTRYELEVATSIP